TYPLTLHDALPISTEPTLDGSSALRAASSEAFIVSAMFVPVSPSGIGKTLSALTRSRWWSSHFVANVSAPNRSSPFHSVDGDAGRKVGVLVMVLSLSWRSRAGRLR